MRSTAAAVQRRRLHSARGPARGPSGPPGARAASERSEHEREVERSEPERGSNVYRRKGIAYLRALDFDGERGNYHGVHLAVMRGPSSEEPADDAFDQARGVETWGQSGDGGDTVNCGPQRQCVIQRFRGCWVALRDGLAQVVDHGIEHC